MFSLWRGGVSLGGEEPQINIKKNGKRRDRGKQQRKISHFLWPDLCGLYSNRYARIFFSFKKWILIKERRQNSSHWGDGRGGSGDWWEREADCCRLPIFHIHIFTSIRKWYSLFSGMLNKFPSSSGAVWLINLQPRCHSNCFG